MKKVAIYCRVSSDDQKERDTIENQVEILKTYIEMKDDLEYVNEYLDNGISGTIPFEKRPEGVHLIGDASKGLFDTVLVYKIDRFGRDTLSGLKAVEVLSGYNIEILSVTEPFDLNTPTGRFQFITYLNMAELERNNILDRMFLGATRAAKLGKWLGGIVPYGYNVSKDGFLEINDSEAEIVRKIFDLYIKEGYNTLSIAVYLNNIGIPSSCGDGKGKRTKGVTGKWRSASVQRIINSTTYKGIHLYGKRASRRKELIERSVPAIISEELWDKAQKVKQRNIRMSKRNNNKRPYLLKGLIKCAHCGKNYQGVSYTKKTSIYMCAGKRGDNKRIFGITCDNLNLKADSIESFVWDDCIHLLDEYDFILDSLTKNSNVDVNNEINDLKKFETSLSKLKSERNSILNLYRKNLINDEDLELQLKDIKKEEDTITQLINSQNVKLESFKHENELIQNMKNELSKYQGHVDDLSHEQKVKLVNLIIKEINVSTICEDGIKSSRVDVVYNLVNLESRKDMDLHIKFDLRYEKENLPYNIGKFSADYGSRIRTLRKSHGHSLKTLSSYISVSEMTLGSMERNKINMPFYYYKVVCDFYNINHVEYLKLWALPEDSIQEKLIKIRALLGARTWDDVGEYLGYSESFITDLLTRYTPNHRMIDKIENMLKKLL